MSPKVDQQNGHCCVNLNINCDQGCKSTFKKVKIKSIIDSAAIQKVEK